MMKYVAETTRPYGIKTNASLNPIMIDGTGMCGGCRLTVGGERKFACVDWTKTTNMPKSMQIKQKYNNKIRQYVDEHSDLSLPDKITDLII